MLPDTDAEKNSKRERFNYQAFMAKCAGATTAKYADRQTIYAQGDPADTIFYIISGTVKISVISEHGKEGVVAILRLGDFFGEGYLSFRRTRATTVTAASITPPCPTASFPCSFRI